MFSQEERAELTQSLDRNLSNAREAMSRLSGHALTAEQFQAVSLVNRYSCRQIRQGTSTSRSPLNSHAAPTCLPATY